MAIAEPAHYWRHPSVPELDLLAARFVRHAFTRHSHDTYAIGVVQSGVELLLVGSGTRRIGAGGITCINPGEVHGGHAADASGWAYRVLYPTVELVSGVVRELGGPAGTPAFTGETSYDRTVGEAFLSAHRAAEHDDHLTSETLLYQAIQLLWRSRGTQARAASQSRPGNRVLDCARQVLMDRMAAPPSLDELAAEVGLGRFALLRGFRERFGLPPHAYLNQERVRRTRALLDSGRRPAEAATEVGFVDQAHLSRHFRRILGVAPGAYLRGR
ncbi:AraC family transcriptional regulator [Allokutzneria sp. A3M-2-11 16]|uniref:AraC family transcriptional regulator n=1 Tax=Allokutzneria sp. A3M-2-11 16 TaxID=2962043 RepID=UPI0020B7C953|nr:AraC family transcriptional regulator [Allokutzneria sp. A3M-2-11 16]MCP3805161.1 AraC family transcriptional regulator [Allokutzneria sp. A3M-2-11 16]